MFLVFGAAAGSAITTGPAITTSFDEPLPDLIIYWLEYSYNESKMNECVLVEVGISNIGEYVGKPYIIKVKLDLDGNEEELSFPYAGEGPTCPRSTLIKFNKDQSTHILTAFVDPPYEGHPNGVMEESDETNNDRIISVYVRSSAKPLGMKSILNNFQ